MQIISTISREQVDLEYEIIRQLEKNVNFAGDLEKNLKNKFIF